MTTQELEIKFKGAVQTLLQYGISFASPRNDTYLVNIFCKMFNKTPIESIPFNWFPDKDLYEDDQGNQMVDWGEEAEINDSISNIETIKRIRSVLYPDNSLYVNAPGITALIIENGILFSDNVLTYLSLSDKFPEEFKKNLVYTREEPDNYMYYVIYTNQGYQCKRMDIKVPNETIEDCYNSDLPYDKIKEVLNSDDSGVIMFHGEPGTGKSFIIRRLAKEVDKNFLYFTSGILRDINNGSLIELLCNNRDSIVILEDCEDLLKDRGVNNNSLSTLLNISDGLLGDGLGIKFICTFNTNLKNIDPAILRKGRMKLKYEFKKLTSEKTYALGQKLGKNIPRGESLTLGDIYNYDDNNGQEKPKVSRIGF